MSRSQAQRLDDILAAIAAIEDHLDRGPLEDGLIFDGVRMRLVEIGEAVKALDRALLATEPSIDWSGVARMRDRITHHYFDTAHAAVEDAVRVDLPVLAPVVRRLLDAVRSTSPGAGSR